MNKSIFLGFVSKENDLSTFNAKLLLYTIEASVINVSHCIFVRTKRDWNAWVVNSEKHSIYSFNFSINVNNFTASIAWPIGKLIYNRNEMTANDLRIVDDIMVWWFRSCDKLTWIKHLDFLFDSFLFFFNKFWFQNEQCPCPLTFWSGKFLACVLSPNCILVGIRKKGNSFAIWIEISWEFIASEMILVFQLFHFICSILAL